MVCTQRIMMRLVITSDMVTEKTKEKICMEFVSKAYVMGNYIMVTQNFWLNERIHTDKRTLNSHGVMELLIIGTN